MPVRTQREDQTKTENGKDAEPPSTIVDRQALIEGLNHDLAGEYQAIVMYIRHNRGRPGFSAGD
jgi:hypothetical protein